MSPNISSQQDFHDRVTAPHFPHQLGKIKQIQLANNMIESYQVVSIEQSVNLKKGHHTKKKNH